MEKTKVRFHFDSIADEYDRWKEKSSYYYDLLVNIYREFVPEGASVLEIGCGTGTILASLRPRRGVGVDISPRMVEIASTKFPNLSFALGNAEALDVGEAFEFVIVPDVIEHLSDVGAMFRSIRKHCGPGTLIIVTSVNPLWAPVLNLAERLKLKMPEGEHRWLAEEELRAFANHAGLTIKTSLGRILCPKRIPFFAPLLNRAAFRYPSLKNICLTQVLVFSPVKLDPLKPYQADCEKRIG